MLLQVYYGQDDNENTLPYLVGCVFIYLAYKWIKSASNTASDKVTETVKKPIISNDLVVPDKEVSEPVKEEPVKHEIALKGSLANLSLKKKAAAESKASKNAVNADSEAENKILLKGSLAGLSFRKSERSIASPPTEEKPNLPVSEDDESVV